MATEALIDPKSLGKPAVYFIADEGRLIHSGPNSWVINLGTVHVGAAIPTLTVDISCIFGALHSWSIGAHAIGPAWNTNLAIPFDDPNTSTLFQSGTLAIQPNTAMRGEHSLTLSTGVIWNSPQGGEGFPQYGLAAQQLTVVDRIV